MAIGEKLNSLPMLRPLGLPHNLRNICLICLQEDVGKVETMIQDYPDIRIGMLIIPDLDDRVVEKIKISLSSGERLKVAPVSALAFCPEYEKVFLCPASIGSLAPLITNICRFLARFDINTLYLYGKTSPPHSMRQPLPDFFRANSALLEQVNTLWADEPSREAYQGRIKALLTGNSAYIPIATHDEYFHPLASPKAGDIMIDGGVSDMVQAQEQFAAAIGNEGRIFGFEPIPRLAREAANQLSKFNNYHLQCAGLADASGTAVFDDLRDSSHIAAGKEKDAPGAVVCQLETIDEFCHKNHLSHIDCIKLDIEGAELSALRGGAETIKKCHPRLIICLYHKPADMTEIPLYIKSLVPEYELFLSHCSCQFIDTILYAR